MSEAGFTGFKNKQNKFSTGPAMDTLDFWSCKDFESGFSELWNFQNKCDGNFQPRLYYTSPYLVLQKITA